MVVSCDSKGICRYAVTPHVPFYRKYIKDFFLEE